MTPPLTACWNEMLLNHDSQSSEWGVTNDRDKGPDCSGAPPSPPRMQVRTRRFEETFSRSCISSNARPQHIYSDQNRNAIRSDALDVVIGNTGSTMCRVAIRPIQISVRYHRVIPQLV